MMSRGVFYKCDLCEHVELIKIPEETPDEKVVREFNELPKGWVKMQVPYQVEGVDHISLHKVVHLCSVRCATLYLEPPISKEEDEVETR